MPRVVVGASPKLTSLRKGIDSTDVAPVRDIAERAREAIAGHHRRQHGIDVTADDVVVTTGSSGGFLLAFLAAFEPGDRVAMARPVYQAAGGLPQVGQESPL